MERNRRAAREESHPPGLFLGGMGAGTIRRRRASSHKPAGNGLVRLAGRICWFVHVENFSLITGMKLYVRK